MRLFHHFIKDREGAAAIEFGLVAIPFFFLIFFIIEASLIFFSAVVIENATVEATRQGKIGADGGGDRGKYIRDFIHDQSFGLINPDKLVITTEQVNPTDRPDDLQPEVCIDAGGVETGDVCPCPPPGLWRDDNPANAICDAKLNPGNPGQVVTFSVLYEWEILTPLGGAIFGDANGVFRIISGGAVRNEPFGP